MFMGNFFQNSFFTNVGVNPTNTFTTTNPTKFSAKLLSISLTKKSIHFVVFLIKEHENICI